MQVRIDNAQSESADSLLVAAMTFLLSKQTWRDELYTVKYIEEWVAKKLRKDEGTDDKAKLARSEAL